MNYIIGIDASRCRSGGAYAHLFGIISNLDPRKFGISKIYLWSHPALIDYIPDFPWLVKKVPSFLRSGIVLQVLWQRYLLKGELKNASCDLLFTLDASTLCKVRNQVVLSQDMLSYEEGVMKLFGFSKSRLRLFIILLLQNNAFRKARGVIFLTYYASKVIQNSCGTLKNYKVIPHGICNEFRGSSGDQKKIDKPIIKCVYVSNTALYKYQWNVVKAIELLRISGFNVEIDLIGGGGGKAKRMLDDQIELSDPKREFVRQFDFVSNSELPRIFSKVDIFIFASGCENMPVTLLEGMSSGLPIVCSQKGPMPEVLEDGGLFFNPEDPVDIAESLKQIILNPQLAFELARRAMIISNKYTWKRCSDETFEYLIKNIKG